jgi:hypothetical protein
MIIIGLLLAYMTGGPEFSLTFFRIINEYEMYRDLVPLPSGLNQSDPYTERS